MAGDDDGQQVVELALVTPVFLLTLILVFNAMLFLSECARFDRVASEVARTAVTVPTGEIQGTLQSRLDTCMGYSAGSRFKATVAAPDHLLGQVMFDHMRIKCTLTYRPWPAPRSFSFPGIGAELNLTKLTHDQTLVIDHYLPAAFF